MFHDLRKTMAVFVMAFILLEGCGKGGRVVRVVRMDDQSSVWQDLSDACYAETDQADVSGNNDSVEDSPDPVPAGFSTHSSMTENGTESPGEKGFLYIHVCGAVNSPGVVKVPEGARVFEAIAQAGGLSEEADEKAINQARLLADGEQVYVPTREETASAACFQGSGYVPEMAGGYTPGTECPVTDENDVISGTGADGKVNINTADAATLQTLNGIGESRAEAIILYRETNGAFETIEDIMKVTGIKNALFNNIKDDITVG